MQSDSYLNSFGKSLTLNACYAIAISYTLIEKLTVNDWFERATNLGACV